MYTDTDRIRIARALPISKRNRSRKKENKPTKFTLFTLASRRRRCGPDFYRIVFHFDQSVHTDKHYQKQVFSSNEMRARGQEEDS